MNWQTKKFIQFPHLCRLISIHFISCHIPFAFATSIGSKRVTVISSTRHTKKKKEKKNNKICKNSYYFTFSAKIHTSCVVFVAPLLWQNTYFALFAASFFLLFFWLFRFVSFFFLIIMCLISYTYCYVYYPEIYPPLVLVFGAFSFASIFFLFFCFQPNAVFSFIARIFIR